MKLIRSPSRDFTVLRITGAARVWLNYSCCLPPLVLLTLLGGCKALSPTAISDITFPPPLSYDQPREYLKAIAPIGSKSTRRFLLGESGELLVWPVESAAHKDTVWLYPSATDQTSLIYTKSLTIETIGIIDQSGVIKWNTSFSKLKNKPATLVVNDYISNPDMPDYSMLEIPFAKQLPCNLPNAKHVFRTYSGDFFVLPEGAPITSAQYHIYELQDLIVCERCRNTQKSEQLFAVSKNGTVRYGNDSSTRKELREQEWTWPITDALGTPVLPPAGTYLLADFATPRITIEPNSEPRYEALVEECY